MPPTTRHRRRALGGTKERSLITSHRARAARPFIEATFGSDERGRFVATPAEGEIARWRERDMPGFHAWLWRLYASYHGAWHLARDVLRMVEGNSARGKLSGESRANNPNSSKAKVLAKAVAYAEAGIDPWDKVAAIARHAGCSQTWVRQILNQSPQQKSRK